MIQRIQTLYLLVVAILMATLLLVPLGAFIGSAEEFVITAWGIDSLSAPEAGKIVASPQMAILIILAGLVPLVGIFLYKKRFLQLRLCVVEIVLLIGVQVYIAMYVLRANSLVSELGDASMRFSVADVLPFIAIILTVMAFRGISRDIALLKSLNRIR